MNASARGRPRRTREDEWSSPLASTFDHPKAPHATVIAERRPRRLEIVLPVEEASPRRRSGRGRPLRRASRRRCGRRGRRARRRGVRRPGLLRRGALPGGHPRRGFLAAHVRAPGAKLYAVNADGRATATTPPLSPHRTTPPLPHPETYRRAGVSGAPSDDGTLKRRCAVNLANKTFSPGTPFRDRLPCAREPWTPRARGAASERTSARTPSTTFRRRCYSPRDVRTRPARCSRRRAYRVRRRRRAAIPLGFVDGTDDARDAAEALEAFFDWLGELTLGRSGEEDADGDARGVDVAGEGARSGSRRRGGGGAADARARRCARVLSTDRARWEAPGGAPTGFRG